MAEVLSWISAVMVGAGAIVVVIGALGLVRMPDVFTRMHASGMIETMGATLMLGGMALTSGLSLVTLKLLVLWVLFIFTGPVAGHALARAALYAGVRPYLRDKDQIARVPQRYGLLTPPSDER
ncbi:MAG: monovalent cation/H(+) antiporter subunit G [Pseudomonadota bacterium]